MPTIVFYSMLTTKREWIAANIAKLRELLRKV
jgi:hypothetical protein